MNKSQTQDCIRLLIADDDRRILDCYRRAFADSESSRHGRTLDALAADLFDADEEDTSDQSFDIVACEQGEDAVDQAAMASKAGTPFDVVILDVRMPPGINGVEAGCRIRQLDPNVVIVIVTGYSDVSRQDLLQRVPPPSKLHYFRKPLSFSQLALDVASMVQTGA